MIASRIVLANYYWRLERLAAAAVFEFDHKVHSFPTKYQAPVDTQYTLEKQFQVKHDNYKLILDSLRSELTHDMLSAL